MTRMEAQAVYEDAVSWPIDEIHEHASRDLIDALKKALPSHPSGDQDGRRDGD